MFCLDIGSFGFWEAFSLDDFLHGNEQKVSVPCYNPPGDGSGPISDWALFQSVKGIQWIWELPKKGTWDWHLCHQSNLMNMQIIIAGLLKWWDGSNTWHKYKRMTTLPIYFDYPHLTMIKVAKNRVIWTDIIKLDNYRTLISPIQFFLGRWPNKALLLHIIWWICLLVF